MIGSQRGRYDRRATAFERAERQRDRLLRATAECVCAGDGVNLTLTRIIERAHVGRAGFHAHFTGVGAALAALDRDASMTLREALSERLGRSRTPLQRLTELGSTLLEVGRSDVVVRAALIGLGTGQTGRVLATVDAELRMSVTMAFHAGALGRPAEPMRCRVLSAGLVELARASAADGGSGERAPAVFEDMVMRTFR